MNRIKLITDKEILGADGMSSKAPRLTARAILKNADDLYAVMYAKAFTLHSLPGGGVEGNEDIVDALRREVFEETGCNCDRIEPLGYVEENRAHQDYTTISYYFIVDTHSAPSQPALTDDEKENGTTVEWRPFDEVCRCITAPVHTTTQRKFLQARDSAALEAYQAYTHRQ